MKRFFILSLILLSILICGTAIANDIYGEYTYSLEESGEGRIIINNISNNIYEVSISTYSNHQVSFFTEFQGIGNLVDGVLFVANQEQIQDRQWIDGKLIELPTSRVISGTLRIYIGPHADVLSHASIGTDYKIFSTMNESQIAIIEEPTFKDGATNTLLEWSEIPSSLQFYREGASGGPGLIGLYTKNSL